MNASPQIVAEIAVRRRAIEIVLEQRRYAFLRARRAIAHMRLARTLGESDSALVESIRWLAGETWTSAREDIRATTYALHVLKAMGRPLVIVGESYA